METDLTLAKAKTMIRQREAVKEQGEILKGTSDESSQRSAVHDQRAFPGRSKGKCQRCGKESHPIQRCPTRNVTCLNVTGRVISGHSASQKL